MKFCMKLEDHRAYKLTIMLYSGKLLIWDQFGVKGQKIGFYRHSVCKHWRGKMAAVIQDGDHTN